MVSVQETKVCIVCGEEYLVDFDCRTGEVTKLSMCACDRWRADAEKFLKQKGLFEEFLKFHEEREKELKKEREEWEESS